MRSMLRRRAASLTFVFLTISSLFALYTTLTYSLRQLPAQLPESIEKRVLSLPAGEPLFLDNALFDHLIFSYPDADIYAGGGLVFTIASSYDLFHVLSLESLSKRFIYADYEIADQFKEDGLLFSTLKKKGLKHRRIKLGHLFKNLVISSTLRPKKQTGLTSAPTGPKEWHHVSVSMADFNGKSIQAISAHPLERSENKVFIEVPALSLGEDSMHLFLGVADSGKCGSCPPVTITLRQGDVQQSFSSIDSLWQEKTLDNFSSSLPLFLEISAAKSGRRHFFFDIEYRIALNE